MKFTNHATERGQTQGNARKYRIVDWKQQFQATGLQFSNIFGDLWHHKRVKRLTRDQLETFHTVIFEQPPRQVMKKEQLAEAFTLELKAGYLK